MKDTIRFSQRTKVILFSLLIILGIIFRYPTTPHEIGWDSFGLHVIANSVSEFGYAKWWLHPTSIVGWYPCSAVPSAVPFLLSGISQCSGRDIEWVMLLYCMILGFISIFGAYLVAGAIWNNDIFKFLVAFVFSVSSGILIKTTWTGHARTLFIILVPLFIYLLLKTCTFKVRFSILTFVILTLLLVTHHYIYLVLPILISYLIISMVYKSGKYIKSIRIPENFANIAVFAGFLIMFLIPYFRRSMWWGDPEMGRVAADVGASSVYAWIFSVMLPAYVRYIGILIIFVAGGGVYLLLKRDKKFEEWFLLLALIGLTPLLYIPTYMKWFIILFACLLIGIGLTNVAITNTDAKKRKYALSFVTILLLISSIYSGYYQYLHFLDDLDPRTRHMEERTYVGALWMKDNIDKDKNMTVGGYITNRVFSTSEVPTLTGLEAADLAYGFVDPNKLEVEQIHSPLSVNFYFHDPYTAINYTPLDTLLNHMLHDDIKNRASRWIRPIYEFNVSYYVENKAFSDAFTRSVQQIKNNIYDNGKIRVWDLKQGWET